MNHLYDRQNNKMISLWLILVCFSIIMMIFIGGLTRLTESGLSITEWNPVSGIIPPTHEIRWNLEFDKYKKSPEYIKHNMGMALAEFKSIYWLEFIHRIAGRMTVLIYALPLFIFLIGGYINKKDSVIYFFALLLLLGQGFMGWYMVKSGLVSNPHVSHYRLAMHLFLAVLLYSIVFWQLMKNSFDIMLVPSGTNLRSVSFWCLTSIVVVFVQIVLGAFVAGLDAGLIYNNFPMMGEYFIPDEVWQIYFNGDTFSNPIFVQFIHRMTAYLLLGIISVFCLRAKSVGNSKLSIVALFVFLSLLLQISLGILTLIYFVPIIFALLHQISAVILLSFLLWAYFLLISGTKDNLH